MACDGLIGVATAETARHAVFYQTLLALRRPANVQMMISRNSQVSRNRSDITQAALEHGAQWVLYLDDDQLLQVDTLERLLAADKDVVSAFYIQRQPPFSPVIMEAELPNGQFTQRIAYPKGKTGLIEVAGAGAGCLLVKRRVLEALEPPYWTFGQIHPGEWCDDTHFCSRVRKAGFSIWCDLDTKIGHIGNCVFWPHEEQGWTVQF